MNILNSNNQEKYNNFVKNQQSDIFIQKGLNKPEIKYTHKKFIPKNTFKDSYNFLDWKDMNPHYDPLIRMKRTPTNFSQFFNKSNSQMEEKKVNQTSIDTPSAGAVVHKKNGLEKMFENEPSKTINNTTERYKSDKIYFGDYEGKEYKIKKCNSTLYDPSLYYVEKSPMKQKMDIIYGGNENIIGNSRPPRVGGMVRSSSCMGYLRKDFETKNDHNQEIVNDPKKMKYFCIYGNRGIENVSRKLKPLHLSNSTSNIYIKDETPSQNKINFLTSNIFDNNDNKKKNVIKVKRTNTQGRFLSQKKINIEDMNSENYGRKGLYKINETDLPKKLDWKDPKTNLFFPQEKISTIQQKNARQRKFKEIYGTEPSQPKEKGGEEFKSNMRPDIDKIVRNNYSNMTYSKMKRLSDNISQNQENKFFNDNKNNNVRKNIDGPRYEVKFDKKKIPHLEIEKIFAEKGLHIYDIKENINSLINNNNIDKVSFKIREGIGGDNFDGKINQVKNLLLKDKGIIMKKEGNNKKEQNDLIPRTLKWNNPKCDLVLKNKKIQKKQENKYHQKAPINRKNEEEKITKIHVNLRYKNTPYIV